MKAQGGSDSLKIEGLPVFVCLCKVVTDGQVEDAIRGGADSVDEVGEECGAGTGCGACHEQIQDMIDRSACPRRAVSTGLYTIAGAAIPR